MEGAGEKLTIPPATVALLVRLKSFLESFLTKALTEARPWRDSHLLWQLPPRSLMKCWRDGFIADTSESHHGDGAGRLPCFSYIFFIFLIC